MPDFVDTAVQEIDERLRELRDEAARLEAARGALTGGRRRRGRPAGNGAAPTPARARSQRNGEVRAPRASQGPNTRANQAIELIRKQPGITIPQIAQAMSIKPNYLYRVLPRLASSGELKRDGQGWHPGSSSTSTGATPIAKAPTRRHARPAKSEPKVSSTRTARSRQAARSASMTSSRTARGATRASILAALARGDAMTAGQVATKAGLPRPTVSTTLSKLAKSGEVHKAKRGYRLTTAR